MTGLVAGSKLAFSVDDFTGELVTLLFRLEQIVGLFSAVIHARSSTTTFLAWRHANQSLKNKKKTTGSKRRICI